MGKIENQLKKITEKCKILYKEQCISTPHLLQAYVRYLSLSFRKDEHNVGIVLHTNSICFDILSITFSAIINLISNETTADDFLDSLEDGMMVLYKGEKKSERYRYEGKELIKEREYIKLSQNKKDGKEYNYVPQDYWTRIAPYNGKSTREDGRGICSKNNGSIISFYTNVLEIDKKDVPNVFDTSSIIITSKENSNIVKDIVLQFGDNKIPLISLTTAAYYTDSENPFYLGANPGKTEALLKFVSKVSTARSLMRSRDGNKHLGIMVLGNQIIHKCETELPGLINKKTLKYLFISSERNTQFLYNTLQENEDISLYACTKKFVQKYSCDSKKSPLLTQLSIQIENIINKKIESLLIENSMLNWELYSSVKRALSIIWQNEYSSEEKEYFIKYSFSILKIFTTAIFNISELEDNNTETGHLTVRERIEELKKLENDLPVILKEKSSYVITVLESLYNYFYESNEKLHKLESIVTENHNKRIAVIVPKNYYIQLLRNHTILNRDNIRIFTPSNFPNQYFDIVVLTSLISTQKFNILTSYNAQLYIPLFYEQENKFFRYEKKRYNESNNFLNSRLTIRSKSFLVPENDDDEANIEEEVKAINEIDEVLNTYISEVDLNIGIKHFSTGSYGKSTFNTEVHKAVTFTDGSRALFTEHYKAYVFDSDEEKISEKTISDLAEGDCLVFTTKNNETKDIVDTILRQLIEDNGLQPATIEAYRKSRKWKQNLHDYMSINNLSVRKLYKLPADKNLQVTEATIRMWMDEDSHTIGPKDIESIKRIANLTNDIEMFQNANAYHDACSEIRKLRRNIMDKIAQAIMDRLTNKLSSSDFIARVVYDKIESISQILEIESIIPYEKTVPIYLTNRPLDF